MVALLAAIAALCLAPPTDDTVPVGKGVTAPRILRKPDPTYSKEAEREHIQGTALYSLVVDKSGHPRDIELLSPIGYGLDEKGLEAIRQWVFAPGMKDGQPVNVRAQIEVNFRFPGISFDEKKEKFRTEYNGAVHAMQSPEHKAKGVETIEELAAKRFPPAMAALGQWMIEGVEVPKDPPGGLDLVRKAADQYDRDGMFFLGRLCEQGDLVPADPEKGLKLIHESSMEGGVRAQIYLGTKYANGQGVPSDPARAQYYFRLCAARNVGSCQLSLGQLLLCGSGGKKDTIAAAAWLQLARQNSVAGADRMSEEALKSMSEEDRAAVDRLKAQLIRK